jgi:hypothetical protein
MILKTGEMNKESFYTSKNTVKYGKMQENFTKYG